MRTKNVTECFRVLRHSKLLQPLSGADRCYEGIGYISRAIASVREQDRGAMQSSITAD